MKPILLLIFCLLIAIGCASNQSTTRSAEADVESTVPFGKPIARGVEFLLRAQNPDGSWGTGLETRGLEIYSMVPGSHDAFRVATTALCVMALREINEHAPQLGDVKAAHDRGVEYLVTSGEARRDSGNLLYNVWAHTYSLEALSIEMRTNTDPRVEAAAKWHLDRMIRYATYVGGWNYYDFQTRTQSPTLGATSFGTAAGMVALWEARKSGLDIPPKLIDSSLRRIEDCRLPTGTYTYGSDHKYIPRLPGNMERGAVGRTQPSNYALWLWGRPNVDANVAAAGFELFIRDHDYLEMGRKRPYPHEAWYQTSGYYYYFDHFYASKLIERLPEPQRSSYRRVLASFIIPHQEPDGSWWDYAMWDYHKPYGTAFAVMTLLRCGGLVPEAN